jgi:hypothetical protein
MSSVRKPKAEEQKPVTTVTRVLGLIGGIAVGALVGAIAMAVATLVAESQSYAGFVPTPTMGGFGGAGIGVILGSLFPEKCAYVFVWLLAS